MRGMSAGLVGIGQNVRLEIAPERNHHWVTQTLLRSENDKSRRRRNGSRQAAMPTLRIVQIDAFTNRVFGGNPAAVVALHAWLPDATLQAIAAENNLAETAFFVPTAEGPEGAQPAYHLRWFTPLVEVDLCGHATLATASLLFDDVHPEAEAIHFTTLSGWLAVTRVGALSGPRSGATLQLDFPARPPKRIPPEERPADLVEALGATPIAVWGARDLMVVFDTEAEVRALQPDMAAIARWDWFAVMATAPGNDCDFVSRFFAPAKGVPEDPVTGSSHTTLIPYWADRLNRRELRARQISPRGGELVCKRAGDRVLIAGQAVRYLEGTITI